MRSYASGIQQLNLAELTMLVYLCFSIVFLRKFHIHFTNKEKYVLTIIIIFIFLTEISAIFIDYFSISSVIGRIVKWIYYFSLLLLSKYFLDRTLAVKLLKVITVIACIALWIQLIAYYGKGMNITFRIPGLRLNTEQWDLLIISYGNVNIYRPYSLFLEPSHFAYYTSIGLCIILFLDENSKNRFDYMLSIFVTVSLIASTSTTAIVFVIVIWAYYSYIFLIERNKNIGNKLNYIVVFIILIFTLWLIFKEDPTIRFAIEKLSQKSSRVNSFYMYLSYLKGFTKIFGVGVGNESFYYLNEFGIQFRFINGFGYVLVQSGYIGFLSYLILLFLIIFGTRKRLRIFVILFFLTNTFELCLRDIYLVVFLIWPFYFEYWIPERLHQGDVIIS